MLRFALVVALLAGTLASAAPAWAHDTSDGSTGVEVGDRRVTVTGTVPFAALGYADTSRDGLIDADELAAQEATVAPTIVASVRERAQLSVDGKDVQIIGAGVPAIGEPKTVGSAASSYVVLIFASGPHDGDVDDVELTWGFERHSSTVVLSYPEGAVTGQLGDDGAAAFSLDTRSSAASFFGLGIDHIRYGPDHLLFLLVLTLAVVGTTVTARTTKRTVQMVTAFTFGHALSLALAYFDVVRIPASIVEPAISLSIVAAAVLAMRGRASHARPWIAALVGVVHGLGFASSLDSLGVATAQQVVALATFNLGIDIAQTAAVLVVIGGLWTARKVLAERAVWLSTSAAASAGVVGLVWTASRLT